MVPYYDKDPFLAKMYFQLYEESDDPDRPVYSRNQSTDLLFVRRDTDSDGTVRE